MKLSVKNLLVLVFSLLFAGSIFGSHEYSNGRLQNSAFTTGNSYRLQDNKYTAGAFSSPPTTFVEGPHSTLLKLGIDHLADATYANAYDITVNVDISYLIYSFGSFSANLINTNLTVKYDPATGAAAYQDIDTKLITGGGYNVQFTVNTIYDNINSNYLTYAPANMYLEAEIDAERYYVLDFINPPYASVSDLSKSYISASDEIVIQWNSIAGAEEYELEWCWASYDIMPNHQFEIDFKNNSTRIRTSEHAYKISKTFEKGYVFFRLRGVGRYDSNSDGIFESEYFTPWTWNDNYTAFTVVTTVANVFTTPSPLTEGMTGISGDVPLTYTVDGIVTNGDPHETLKNWQYNATYAEDGKKKEVISYFDGTLRNRQSVTKNNSDVNAIVGETYYDYQGRPAIQALPVPVQDAAIKFYETGPSEWGFNFVAGGAGQAYDKRAFDLDYGTCPPPPIGMDNGYGSSYYYSQNNTDLAKQQAYLPDAELFPFTQTEYTPDKTGRILRQSNVGADLKLGTNHETKYFYGSPTAQVELDRLFGSEVGYYNHYKKNMVIDPNGQVSISYIDLSGKTIATALTGTNPANLRALDPLFASSTITGDLLNKENSSDPNTDLDNNIIGSGGKELVFTKEMLVTEEGDYEFQYDMFGTAFTYACSGLCYDCIYDLEIDILDKCASRPNTAGGSPFTPVKKKVGNIDPLQVDGDGNITGYETGCCEGPVHFTDLTTSPIIVHLYPGAYTVIKKLSIDENAMNFYLDAYLNDTTGCVKSEYQFVNDATAAVDVSGCDVDCEDCVTALGSLATFTTTGGGTVAQYNELVRQCREPCAYTDQCQSNYYALLADVSPGGQYAEFDNGGCDPSPFALSLLNSSNVLPSDETPNTSDDPVWDNPNLQYKNDDGTNSYITIVQSAGPVYLPAIKPSYVPATPYPAVPWVTPNSFTVIPQALNDVCDFKNVWKKKWAEELVKFHPEYAYYEYCIQNSKDYHTASNYSVTMTSPSFNGYIRTSKDYDSLLLVVDDLANVSPGDLDKLIDPLGQLLGGTVHDPYFLENVACVWTHPGTPKSGLGTSPVTSNQYSSTYNAPFGQKQSIVSRFNNYKGTGANLWQFAYAAANCGTLYGLTNWASISAASCYLGYSGPAAFNKAEWQMFKMLYLALKQEMQNEAAQTYALHHLRPASALQYNSCNDCIGNTSFNPMTQPLAFKTYWGLGWFSNWFYFPSDAYLAPCGFLRMAYYPGRIKRFPSTSDISGLTSSTNPGASLYQLTGKCPLALDLESTLNEMAVAGTTTLSAGTSLLTVKAFSKILYDAVYGSTPPNYNGLTWASPALSSGNKNLSVTIKDGSTNLCNFTLNFPGSSSYSWANTIVKIYDIKFINYAAGVSNFTVKATIKVGSNYYDETLTGTICANIGACGFDPPCTANGNAQSLQNLIGMLAQNGDLCSSTAVPLTTAPYNILFTNTLGQSLPSGSWGWNYIGSTGSVSATSITNSITVNFVSGMNGVGELCSLMSSSNSNSITVISLLPTATTGGFNLVYTYMIGTTTYTGVVTGDVTTTNGSAVTSPFSMGTCDIKEPLCSTPEHQIKKDLEIFLADAQTNNYFTSSSAVNITSNVNFTSSLQSQVSSTLSVSTSSPYMVSTVSYYWQNVSVTASNTFSASICTSTTGSAPTPGSSCCQLTFSINPAIGMTQYDIQTLGPMTVLNNPTIGGESYSFYMTAKFFDGTNTVYDTLFGSTTCFPIRGCETCTSSITFSTISTAFTLVDDFNTSLSSGIPANHTPGTGCEPASSPYPISYTSFSAPGSSYALSGCDYGIAQTAGPGTAIYNSYLGSNGSYFIYVTAGATTSYSTTVYSKNITISSAQKCYGLEGFYIKAVDWHHVLELYLNGTYVGSQTIYWEGPSVTPTWHKLNFGGATWNNSSAATSLNIKIVAKPLLPAFGAYQGSLNTFLGLDDLKLYELPCGIIPCVNEQPSDTMPVITYTNPCAELMMNAAIADAKEDYYNYIDSLKTGFVEGYIKKCIGSAVENFSVTYNAAEYQFTLYYYDQAGNLVRTVPPQGVNVVTSSSDLNDIKTERLYYSSIPKTFFTAHTFTTTYTYNSLNQLVKQNTPDATLSFFWYDKLGRLVASQNTEQFAGTGGTPRRYSYTKYDPLGRIFETGQVALSSTLTFTAMSTTAVSNTINAVSGGTWPNNVAAANSDITQVVRTYYGDDDNYLTGANGLINKPTVFTSSQDYIRSRVGTITYEDVYDADDTTYNHATFFNYDIHGNVKELCQVNPDMAWAGGHENKKHIQYEYDLISGKVNKVRYQPGYIDQFYHKYDYDADNRITHAYTSRDNILWDNDAKYFYYKHGPLARVELGEAKVQGFDYAYTLQGWIKGTNSEILETAKDIGKDASGTSSTNYNTLNQWFAKDAMGYNLNYFTRGGGGGPTTYDYIPADPAYSGSGSFKADPSAIGLSTTGPALFNGNISHMATSFLNMDPSAVNPATGAAISVYQPVIQLSAYRYDQLNRIVQSKVYKHIVTATNSWLSNATNVFQERFAYDRNGNLLNAQRNDASTATFPSMDNITYNYYGTTPNFTNKLEYVNDGISSSSPTDDIEPQSSGNYTYDLNGNLKTDVTQNITDISWTVYGKPGKITRGSSANDDITFMYDAFGNRVSKRLHTPTYATNTDRITYYVRDAQGNVMATYKEHFIRSGIRLDLEELSLYGSTRLGNIQKEITVPGTPAANPTHTMCEKNFELDNHLGNVISVVNDHKAVIPKSNPECIGVFDFPTGYSTASWALQVNGVGAAVTAGEQLKVTFTSGAITGINPAFGDNITPGTYMIEFDWDPGDLDASDDIQIEPFDVQWNPGLTTALTFYMSTPFWSMGSGPPPPKGHYSFLYTPSATGTDVYTHVAFNTWNFGAPTSHTFIVDNISMCPVDVAPTIVDYHNPDIVSHSDYYAFGANKPGTVWTSLSSPYKYTFNGKEKDPETVGTSGATQDYGMRIYNPSLGRFLSIDPITSKYPELTPYQFASNSPIAGIDQDGLELIISTDDPMKFGKVLGGIMCFYATTWGGQIIDEVNSPKHITPVIINSKANQTTKDFVVYLEDDNIDKYGTAHELDHLFWKYYYQGKDTYQDVEDAEKSAVKTENYFRSVMGNSKMRTEYDFPWYEIFSPPDIKFDANPSTYNGSGENVKVTGFKMLSKNFSNLKESYKFEIKKYSADAPEIKNAKSGAIMYYDYKKDKDSKVEKMAIKVDIYNDGKLIE